VLHGVARHFQSFEDIAVEAGLSRMFAGVHSRLDHEAGRRLGAVARFVSPKEFVLGRNAVV
jgi:hypothetical protein